ncbi:hypothetical protein WJX73_003086 [Symbiochloris irregularis]|uniref:TF-B3 domain-containing protein n=1 Tax=Symbiochloris irregularis TaxID=706552 RepID=A0AAW1NX92_9CHLO
MVDQGGRTWQVDIAAKDGVHVLEAGWQSYAAAWNLVPGDVLGWHADTAHPGIAAVAILNRAAQLSPLVLAALPSTSQPEPVRTSLSVPYRRRAVTLPTTREGPCSVRLVLREQSGMFGTAFRLTKATSLVLFPGVEANFEGKDLEIAEVQIVDPAGKPWTMAYTLRRYRSKGRTSATRQLANWAQFATAWSLRETEVLSIELDTPESLTLKVALLTREPGFQPSNGSPDAPSSPKRKNTISSRSSRSYGERSVLEPFCTAGIPLKAQHLDGRPLRLPASVTRLFFPSLLDGTDKAPNIQDTIMMMDADDLEWEMRFNVKRTANGNVMRYLAGVTAWMRAWGVREGDRVSFEVLSLQPLKARIFISNRPSHRMQDAVPGANRNRGTLGGGRVSGFSESVAGPLGVKFTLASGMESGRCLKVSAKTAAFLFPEVAHTDQGTLQASVSVVDEAGGKWPMTFVSKKYSAGTLKSLQEWSPYSNGWSLGIGDLIGFERRDMARAEIHVSVVRRQAGAMVPLEIAGPVSIAVTLSRSETSAGGWPLRLNKRTSMALFPEKEAEFMATGTALLEIKATEDTGQDFSMTYQVKPHQGRSAETRHLQGWHRLALHLGAQEGDKVGITRTSEPAEGTTPSVMVQILSRAARQDSLFSLPSRLSSARDSAQVSELAMMAIDEPTSPTSPTATAFNSLSSALPPLGIKFLLNKADADGRPLRLSKARALLLLPACAKAPGDSATIPLQVIDPSGKTWSAAYSMKRYVNQSKGGAGSTFRMLLGWSGIARAWHLQQGDIIGLERQSQACDTLHLTMVKTAQQRAQPDAGVLPGAVFPGQTDASGTASDWVRLDCNTPVGRTIHLTQRLCLRLFPELEVHMASQQGLRQPVIVEDDDGTRWPMVYVGKRYGLGTDGRKAGTYRTLNAFSDFERAWGVYGGSVAMQRVADGQTPTTSVPEPSDGQTGQDSKPSLPHIRITVLNAISAKHLGDQASSCEELTALPPIDVRPLSVSFPAKLHQGQADALEVPPAQAAHLFGGFRQDAVAGLQSTSFPLDVVGLTGTWGTTAGFSVPTDDSVPSSIAGPAGMCLKMRAEGRNKVLNATRAFGRLFFPEAEAAFLQQDSVDHRCTLVDTQGHKWDVMYCLRRYRPKGLRRAVVLHRDAQCDMQEGIERRGSKGRNGLIMAANAMPVSGRLIEGPRGMRMTVTAAAMKGRAIQINKGGWAMLFPDVESAFAVADDISQQIVIIDTNGARWPMQYCLHRYRAAAGTRHTQRQITDWAPFSRPWGLEDGDVIAVERRKPPLGELHLHVLNRTPTFSLLQATAAAAPGRTMPTAEGPLGIKLRIGPSTMNGRSMTLNKHNGVLLLGTAERAFETSDVVDCNVTVIDHSERSWQCVYSLRRAPKTMALQKRPQVTRILKNVGDCLKAWAVQQVRVQTVT